MSLNLFTFVPWLRSVYAFYRFAIPNKRVTGVRCEGPVWSKCGPGRFGKSSIFSLRVSNTNTNHSSEMLSPLQQLEKIRYLPPLEKNGTQLSGHDWFPLQAWTARSLQLILTMRTPSPGEMVLHVCLF